MNNQNKWATENQGTVINMVKTTKKDRPLTIKRKEKLKCNEKSFRLTIIIIIPYEQEKSGMIYSKYRIKKFQPKIDYPKSFHLCFEQEFERLFCR